MSEQGLAQLGADLSIGLQVVDVALGNASEHMGINVSDVVSLAAVDVAGPVAALLSRPPQSRGSKRTATRIQSIEQLPWKQLLEAQNLWTNLLTPKALKPQLPDTAGLPRDYTLVLLGSRSSVRITQGAFQSGIDFSPKSQA